MKLKEIFSKLFGFFRNSSKNFKSFRKNLGSALVGIIQHTRLLEYKITKSVKKGNTLKLSKIFPKFFRYF